MLQATVDFWIVSQVLNQRDSHVSVKCHFVLTIEPSSKTPTLICRCLQALAEALEINKSMTNIALQYNQIGAEGNKAWCVWMGFTEYSLNAAACIDVIF